MDTPIIAGSVDGPIRWHCGGSADEVSEHLAYQLASLARRSIKEKGNFQLVSAGGRSLLALYRKLVSLNCDWLAWHIYFADERCLPDGHPERNSTILRQAFFDRVPIPTFNVHEIPVDIGPTRAAKAYADIMTAIGCPDLALLGLGEDGHVASLFPHARWETDCTEDRVISVDDAPKPLASRVSLSIGTLNRARHIWCLALGTAKKLALARWQAGESIPAAALSCENGVDVWADRLAWSAGFQECLPVEDSKDTGVCRCMI